MYRDLFMRAARKVSPSGWIKIWRISGLCDVPVTGVCGDLVSGGRRLASDYGGSQFKHRCFDVDGAVYGYFLDYCRRLFKVSRYQQVKA